MRAARHAGPAIDSAAVTPRTTVTNANVARSSGRTPNSIVSIRRPDDGRERKPDRRSRGDDAGGVADHEAKHVVRRRAERPAHAEITHALLNRVGEHSEHADHRKDERQRRKGDHHHGAEAMAAGGRPRDVFERHDVS